MSIALKVAVSLSYVASAASLVLFGQLGPSVPESAKERVQSAKKFVDELQASEDGLDAAQGMSEDGMDKIEMEEFAKYLEVLEAARGDGATHWRKCLVPTEDPNQSGRLTWTTPKLAEIHGGKSHISLVNSTLKTLTDPGQEHRKRKEKSTRL